MKKLNSKKVHVVPHTHWDFEWYFNTEISNLLLIHNIDSILETLENNSEYKYYTLDGQISLMDVYLKYRPENKNRVKKLINSGRLLVGPWYSQTNQNLVHGESLVRNLLIGTETAKKLGSFLKVGYIPDSFGQTAQLPQILNNFNIDKAVFWRGVSQDKSKYLNFNWRLGKYEVKVSNIRFGYALGKYLPNNNVKIKKRLKTIFGKLDPYIGEDDYLLGNGHDQMPIQINLVDTLKKINAESKHNFIISNFDKYIDGIDYSQKKYVSGELFDSEFSRIHRTMSSSRMDIKIYAANLENKMIHILEPLTAIAFKLGIKYEQKWINEIWKLLLFNNSHDSLGGCVSDDVAKNIISRFERANRMISSSIEDIKRQIAMGINNNKTDEIVVVYNLTPRIKNKEYILEIISEKQNIKLLHKNNTINQALISKENIDIGLVNKRLRVKKDIKYFKHLIKVNLDVPAFGFTTLNIIESNLNNSKLIKKDINFIENKFYKIIFNDNGTINIFDKLNKREFKNQLLFINEENVGDSYDYSPLGEESIKVTSWNVKSKIELNNFNTYQTANIKFDWDLPKTINDRIKNNLNTKNKISIDIKLKNNSNFIDFKVKYKNKALNQRTRVLFDLNQDARSIKSFQSFGPINRSTKLLDKNNWVEKFVTTYPFVNILKVEDASFNLISKTMREYDFINNSIMFTLLSSVEYLGLSNLKYRPGRSSGIPVHIPDAQMIKEIAVDFSISTHKISDARIGNIFKEYATENIYFNKRKDMEWNKNTDLNNIKIPSDFSLFEDCTKKLVLESVKVAKDEDGIIIRYTNPNEEDVNWNLSHKYRAIELKMNEEDIVSKNKFEPMEVRTWKMI